MTVRNIAIFAFIFVAIYFGRFNAISQTRYTSPYDDTTGSTVETPAIFNGTIQEYISTHLIYPNDARENEIEGVVTVSFQINTSGAVQNAVITKSLFPSLDAEALRIINGMPAWTPAKTNGTPVNSDQKTSVTFRL